MIYSKREITEITKNLIKNLDEKNPDKIELIKIAIERAYLAGKGNNLEFVLCGNGDYHLD